MDMFLKFDVTYDSNLLIKEQSKRQRDRERWKYLSNLFIYRNEGNPLIDQRESERETSV